MENYKNMPLGERIAHIEKMRKRRKRQNKDKNAENDAFTFFFNNK